MQNKLRLSKNSLKILAAISMVTDHVGYVFFPEVQWMRIIGRLAFPVFAFSIYEGCRYTRNTGKYLLRVFLLGAICFIGYFIYARSIFFNVVISFSVAIVIISALRSLKKQLASEKKDVPMIFFSALWAVSATVFAYILCMFFEVDYGFWGIMLPVSAELADISLFIRDRKGNVQTLEKTFLLTGFAVGLVILAADMGGIQFYSLTALLPIALTGNIKGRLKLKYFFYIFYPLHLLVIEGLACMIK